MTNVRTYGLCEGRHPIPVEEYIFSTEINPLDLEGMEKKAEEVLKPRPYGCGGAEAPVNLYVTGLTVALVAVINVCYRYGIELCLWHYNKDTGDYYPQGIDMSARCDLALYGVRNNSCYGL